MLHDIVLMWYLQIKYNPQNILGFGLSDGEVVERVWSYLRRFAAMTKEMHPSHQIDVLSDGLSYYCQKSARNLGRFLIKHTHHHVILIKLGKLLPKRLLNAQKVDQESTSQLQELMDSSPGITL